MEIVESVVITDKLENGKRRRVQSALFSDGGWQGNTRYN